MTNFYNEVIDSKKLVNVSNLQFNLRYPLYKTPSIALDRFKDIQQIIDNIPKIEDNRNTIFKYLNECDFILNTLEGYDL